MEQYNRTHNLQNKTFTTSRIKPKIAQHAENQGAVTHFQGKTYSTEANPEMTQILKL